MCHMHILSSLTRFSQLLYFQQTSGLKSMVISLVIQETFGEVKNSTFGYNIGIIGK
jgi:hypothetical protein